MHLHLDLVGGLSGNMFVGGMLDHLQIPASALLAQIELAGFAEMVTLTAEAKNDGILTGTYFNVDAAPEAHQHRHYIDIRQRIQQSSLEGQTIEICLGIFQLLAEAEAQVHDRKVEEVAFHEVGAWDSIADIVTAAWLIGQANIKSSSVSPLPIGGGRVETAHGSLPVPAPATALLLQGFEFFDDGISGERITPTGAAILKYLNPGSKPTSSVLVGSGYGFGSKTFPGISNVVRMLFLQDSRNLQTESKNEKDNNVDAVKFWLQDTVVQLQFEIDDQTPEDLSIALENMRAHKGVHDVHQNLVYGKKGRMVIAIQALIDPAVESAVLKLCFHETTTLGIRRSVVERAILARTQESVSIQGDNYSTKVATRPGPDSPAGTNTTTKKVESDDIAHLPGIKRRQLKAVIENQIDSAPGEK